MFPQTLFLPPFSNSLVITGSLKGRFVRMVWGLYWLILEIRLAQAQFLELKYMHQHMNRDG